MAWHRLWKYVYKDGVTVLVAHSVSQTCPGVKVAAALLIDGELWGFYTPDTVSVNDVKTAASRVQPYYAVPTQLVALPNFPHTRYVRYPRSGWGSHIELLHSNGKTDKRALRQLALTPPKDVDRIENAPRVIDFTPLEKATLTNTGKLPIDPTRPEVDTFDGTLWLHLLSSPPSKPPPVYQRDFKPYDMSAAYANSLRRSSSSTTAADMKTEASSTSSMEMSLPWAGYEDDELPNKTQGRLLRNLRHQGMQYCSHVLLMLM